jgi:hypothetical protein
VTPDAALKQTFKGGNYYAGPVSELVKRLEYVREQLRVLEGMPGKMPAGYDSPVTKHYNALHIAERDAKMRLNIMGNLE